MNACSHCAEEWHRNPFDISVKIHFQDRWGTASYVLACEQNPYPIWFPCHLKGYLCTKYRSKLSLSTHLIKQNLASYSSLFCNNGAVEFSGNYAVRPRMGKESPISRTIWWKVSFFEPVKLFENDMCGRDFLSLFFFCSKRSKIILQLKREEGASGFHMYKWQYLQHQSKHLRCLLLLQGCWQRICRWAFHYLIVMWSTFVNCYFPTEHHFQKTDKTRLVD